jgi:hypothetical protein
VEAERESWRLRLGAREKSGVLPLGIEIDARLRKFSKDGEAEGAVTVTVEPAGVPSRLENFSRALIRDEMPEDTLIFLAIITGVGGPFSV